MADPVVDVGAPPAATGSSGTSPYLGVPGNYVYNPPGNVISTAQDPVSQILGFTGQAAVQPPRYKTGDEMSITSLPPEVIAQLQSGLATAGLISPSAVVHTGLADAATVSAFKALLSFANINGMDWQTAISQLDANPPVKASAPITMPSPVDEDNAVFSAAKTLFGHDPTQQEIDGFRPYYDSLTKQSQLQQNPVDTSGLTDTTGGGSSPFTAQDTGITSVTATPPVGAAAEQFLRQTDPGEVANQQYATKYLKVLSVLGGKGMP